MSKQKYKTWWEDHADPETFLQVQQPRTRNVRQIIYDMMNSVLDKGSSVLDVACGPAVDYKPITDMGFKWTGVDMTKKFVTYVRDTFDADMHQMDVSRDLNFKTQQFTMSYAKDLFEHLGPSQWKGVVREMWRVSSEYMLLSFFKPPDENDTEYRKVTEEENSKTAGVYSNQYSRKEFVDYIRKMPEVHTVSIKESLLYRKRWTHPKGYSVWLVKRREKV